MFYLLLIDGSTIQFAQFLSYIIDSDNAFKFQNYLKKNRRQFLIALQRLFMHYHSLENMRHMQLSSHSSDFLRPNRTVERKIREKLCHFDIVLFSSFMNEKV